jgi:hypothetical protein
MDTLRSSPDLTRRQLFGAGGAAALLCGSGALRAATPGPAAPASQSASAAAPTPAEPPAVEPMAPASAPAAEPPAPLQPLPSPAQRREEAALLRDALQTLHPGLYRYRKPAELDTAFAAMAQAFAAAPDIDALRVAAQRMAAFIRCRHTGLNPLHQGRDLQVDRLARADCMPLLWRVVERRLIVSVSLVPGILRGDEVLSIDGKPVAAVIDALWPLLAADGSTDAARLVQLGDEAVAPTEANAFDRFFSALQPPGSGGWTLRVRNTDDAPPTQVQVPAVSLGARAERLRQAFLVPPPPRWSFDVQRDVARMDLPTFDFVGRTAPFAAAFDWQAWLARSFQALREQRITKLLIDLRANDGGGPDDEAVAALLTRYLANATVRPEPYDARVVAGSVPLTLAAHLQAPDRRDLQRESELAPAPGPLDARYQRFTRGALADRDPAPLQPMDLAYKGRVAVLIGPLCQGAVHRMLFTLKSARLATLVGGPTGGNLRGDNGSPIAWLALPYSGVAIDVPLVAWLPRRPLPDEPVLPHLPVNPSVNGWRFGHDEVFDAGLKWLG